jgi:copper oxidase (laccase) domain-containing protein
MALLRSSLLEDTGFRHAFPTNDATDAELLAHLRDGGGGIEAIVQVHQVHGAAVVVAGEHVEPLGAGAPRNQPAAADAVVGRSGRGRVAVGVRVADCVPILVGDQASGDVVAIHAGWRGVVLGIVPAAIAGLFGVPPSSSLAASRSVEGFATPRADRLVAAIGPCIGACCFEVGRDVAARIGFVAREAGEKAYVDLRAAVRAQLVSAGLTTERIEDVPGCTKHEPDRFHSFRRDGANSGRMLAAVATNPYPVV